MSTDKTKRLGVEGLGHRAQFCCHIRSMQEPVGELPFEPPGNKITS